MPSCGVQNEGTTITQVVLDVGTGSGVLALFAAKAGARKVYAVEATDMAKHARTVVEANGVQLASGPLPLNSSRWSHCRSLECSNHVKMPMEH